MHGKAETEKAIKEHMSKARDICTHMEDLSGDSRKVMEELIEWVGTRNS
jgi:hypothetical protein